VSTRRIPKGPGRHPKSLELRLFMELIAKGVPIRAACRELGIAPSGAHRWLHGGRVVLKDGRVKHIQPIERNMPREISPRYLSEAERVQIADLLAQGMNASQISRELGRAVSTISRELRRNAHATSGYRPFHAHALAAGRLSRPKELKVVSHSELTAVIEGKRRVRWSPAQISRCLERARVWTTRSWKGSSATSRRNGSASKNPKLLKRSTQASTTTSNGGTPPAFKSALVTSAPTNTAHEQPPPTNVQLPSPTFGDHSILRQYFPNGTDLSIYSPADLARVEKELNNRPRLVLGDATPEQLFTQMLTSQK
jgi:transposase-like protein